MQTRILHFAIFSFLCSAPTSLYGDIKLAAPYITSLVQEDGKGYYQKILEEASLQFASEISESFFPYKRALLLFERKEVDCIYSFTKVFQEKLGTEAIIYSYPLGAFAYYIFSPPSEPAVSHSSEIVGKRVGGTLGHDEYYKDALVEGVEMHMVDKDQQNLTLLGLGRLDFMIGALPDLAPYLDQLNYDENAPLIQSFDRITCHASDNNRAFISKISKSLRQLNQSGRYQEIGKNLYLQFEDNEEY